MEFGILGWAGVHSIGGIQEYAREGEVIAIGIAAVMHDRRLDEAVRRQRDRASLYAA